MTTAKTKIYNLKKIILVYIVDAGYAFYDLKKYLKRINIMINIKLKTNNRFLPHREKSSKKI